VISGTVDALRRVCVMNAVDCSRNFRKELDCLDTCQHLTESQFLTTTDTLTISLAEACQRKVERAELVEIFKCLEFFRYWRREGSDPLMQIFEISPRDYKAR